MLSTSIGNDGTCYRVGGDEFTAIIKGENPPEIWKEVLSRLLHNIEHYNKDKTGIHRIIIAHGVSFASGQDADEIAEAERIADARMYENKASLKNDSNP